MYFGLQVRIYRLLFLELVLLGSSGSDVVAYDDELDGANVEVFHSDCVDIGSDTDDISNDVVCIGSVVILMKDILDSSEIYLVYKETNWLFGISIGQRWYIITCSEEGCDVFHDSYELVESQIRAKTVILITDSDVGEADDFASIVVLRLDRFVEFHFGFLIFDLVSN